jgi:hypothetical protein
MAHFENIVNMHPDCAVALCEAASRGSRFRIATGRDADGDTWVKWDAGSGWTPPYFEVAAKGKPHFPAYVHALTDVCPGYAGDEDDENVPASCKGGHSDTTNVFREVPRQ